MIPLTRLDGSVVVVNADLIETVERHGDTVLTLVSGTRFVVREDIAAITDAILRFRGSILGFVERAAQAGHTGAGRAVTANPSPAPPAGEERSATVIPLSVAQQGARPAPESD